MQLKSKKEDVCCKRSFAKPNDISKGMYYLWKPNGEHIRLERDDERLTKLKMLSEWINENNLVGELQAQLKEQQLEKTFAEVYVMGKTEVESLVDVLQDYGKDMSEEVKSKMIADYLKNQKKKNSLQQIDK